MQIISDGKINSVQIALPFETSQVKSEWELYIDKFYDILEPYLRYTKQKPWDKRRIAMRLNQAKIKRHHVREFFEECEDKGFNAEKYNFYVHFFSKTKIIFKTIK